MTPSAARRAVAASTCLYCWLLAAYPAGFRQTYASHMAQLFGDLCRDSLRRRGLVGLGVLWWHMLPDLLASALQEHLWGWRRYASVVLMAAVVAVFQLIPFSVVLGPGISFPLSLSVIGLAGILLGPWAGAAAVAIGGAVGVIIAPHTAWLGPITALVMVITPVGTGLVTNGKRAIVGIYLIAASLVWWGLFIATNGFPRAQGWTALLQPWRYLLPGILLLLPVLTDKAVRLLKSENRLALGASLGYLIWIGGSLDHTLSSIIGNLIMFRLPEEAWSYLTLYVIGAERGALVLVGLVVGMSMMFGQRRMKSTKPLNREPFVLRLYRGVMYRTAIYYRLIHSSV